MTEEPADMESSKWKKWSVTNSLILVWLLYYMTLAFGVSVKTLPNVSTVWTMLSTRYSSKGNLLMSQIEDKIHAICQGDRTMLVYVNKLQHLWADLDQYVSLQLPHAKSMDIAEVG